MTVRPRLRVDHPLRRAAPRGLLVARGCARPSARPARGRPQRASAHRWRAGAWRRAAVRAPAPPAASECLRVAVQPTAPTPPSRLWRGWRCCASRSRRRGRTPPRLRTLQSWRRGWRRLSRRRRAAAPAKTATTYPTHKDRNYDRTVAGMQRGLLGHKLISS